MMNCSQIKDSISIPDYLQKMGLYPFSQHGKYLRYFSPLRAEKTPSFDVNHEKNTFIDWGSGEQGDIIQLVQLIYNVSTSKALKILHGYNDSSSLTDSFSFQKQKISVEHDKSRGKIGIISDNRLIRYMAKRGISKRVWSNCTKLKQYSYPLNQKRPHNCGRWINNLAWINDSRGYELNNEINNYTHQEAFKSCLRRKDITTLKGPLNKLNLFEGFFDYLSALEYFNLDYLEGTTIVLNTTSIVDRVFQQLQRFDVVYCYFDNDGSGKATLKEIAKRHSKVIDQSVKIYPGYNDFNEFLIYQCNAK